MIGELYV
ncbi:Protein of unknown function [Propionibacterium freudenreichii]|nr:Protein of unknown function [Propionibacterium freudenreichii]CEH07787.1 Protein of unknown function [Propionibacterium freudenreichii]CEI46199.1 Protein of unknown function [Propionibacterium freudenreichii]